MMTSLLSHVCILGLWDMEDFQLQTMKSFLFFLDKMYRTGERGFGILVRSLLSFGG